MVDTLKGQCPVAHVGKTNRQWWPNQVDVSILAQHSERTNPLPKGFNYRQAFLKLDLDAVEKDLRTVMQDSQSWWPADFGHYGPFFIRMAWHSAGTYRVADGRGGAGAGTQRFAPLNSWPDNVNLDKARRLLWPIKQKYGLSLSWADLMIFAGNIALESMGFKTFGFAGGREDVFEPANDIFWGPEGEWLADERYSGDRQLANPLGAVQMGLIYVNPEGPNGKPDPLASARDIRETFYRMAMNDEETVALIAGGHTFGKTHGAADPKTYVGPEPEAAEIEAQGLGWKNTYHTGVGKHAISSGLEVTWTQQPTAWTNLYLKNLYQYEWELTKSPAGAWQWCPKNWDGQDAVPDAHEPQKNHPPQMLTSDLALRFDPAYDKISRAYLADQNLFADAFARAWYKLTHRDMGPRSRYLGARVPHEILLWQDPLPEPPFPPLSKADEESLKRKIAASGLSPVELVKTAWASASTFRGSDKRGGANGARIRLAPQKTWEVNEPEALASTLNRLEEIRGAVQISLADMIVLAGNVGIEQAAKAGGFDIEVPFTPGRTDATQDMTDSESFQWLEPKADAFRNYHRADTGASPEVLLVDRAQLLTLTLAETTVLWAGLRAIGANWGHTHHGVFTHRAGTLSNDVLVNLLDMNVEWVPHEHEKGLYEARDRKSGARKWTATRTDLIFGSHAQFRACAEIFAQADGQKYFITRFVKAWEKVMNLDRFDIA